MTVRQHLQLLLGVERLNKSMQLDSSATRKSVARLALALFNSSPYSACQPSFIEPLVRLYKGTNDAADNDLLAIYGLYERYKRVSLSKAISALYTPQLSMAADENETALDALRQLDPKIVFASCVAFERKGRSDEEKTTYDTRFVLSLAAATLREGSLTGLQWVEILRSNVLALATCALSSKTSDLRTMAGWILGAGLELIQVSNSVARTIDMYGSLNTRLCHYIV
jgi:nucleolar pre-ribosomal-associated protein 1